MSEVGLLCNRPVHGWLYIYYGDDEYSDFTLILGTKTIPLHRIVVCSQSRWFEAACKQNTFKVRRSRHDTIKLSITDIMREGFTRKIQIATKTRGSLDDGDDEAAIIAMLRYFYEDADPLESERGDLSVFEWTALLYITADKYEAQLLSANMAQRFDNEISRLLGRQNYITYEYEQDKEMHGLLLALQLIYERTAAEDKKLKHSALRLFSDPEMKLIRVPAVREVVKHIPDLCDHLLAYLGEEFF